MIQGNVRLADGVRVVSMKKDIFVDNSKGLKVLEKNEAGN